MLELTALLLVVSALAGYLGALTGLGGGVVIVPVLTLVFGVSVRYAIGASLVSVIATSSGAAAAYVREGFTNIRIGMFLQMGTCVGALIGAYLATSLSTRLIAVIFALVLLYSAWLSFRRKDPDVVVKTEPEGLAKTLDLYGMYPTREGEVPYTASRPGFGLATMTVAGVLSGLLGIGSGAVKVIAMDQVMGLPFKVSTTTSNFMIGVTAAASTGVYLHRGYIDPGLSMPVMLGALLGSLLGARKLAGSSVDLLRIIFALTIATLAVEMLYKGLVGGI